MVYILEEDCKRTFFVCDCHCRYLHYWCSPSSYT